MRFRDTSPQRQQVLAARRAGKSRNRAAQCPKRKTAFGDRHMSTNSGNLENFQSQRMDILEKTLADKERTVERLQQDCAYYQRVILALSRSRITADELIAWLAEEPTDGMTFEEVMGELASQKGIKVC
jgi:hypothetical protein